MAKPTSFILFSSPERGLRDQPNVRGSDLRGHQEPHRDRHAVRGRGRQAPHRVPDGPQEEASQVLRWINLETIQLFQFTEILQCVSFGFDTFIKSKLPIFSRRMFWRGERLLRRQRGGDPRGLEERIQTVGHLLGQKKAIQSLCINSGPSFAGSTWRSNVGRTGRWKSQNFD